MNIIPSFYRDYKIIKQIGEGEFGVVFKVEKDEKFYALKVKKFESEIEPFVREILILNLINEKQVENCVKYYSHALEICKYSSNHLLNYEKKFLAEIFKKSERDFDSCYVKVAILLEHLKDFKPLSFCKINKDTIENVKKVILNINKEGIQHRDLNKGNVMYNEETKKVILIDFGCAIQGEDNEIEEFEKKVKYW